jgi:hypothetical protein
MRSVYPTLALWAVAVATVVPASGQAYGPDELGTTYGMFGVRALGEPLAPYQQRTLFAGEPHDRFGAHGVGAGGPQEAYYEQQIAQANQWLPLNERPLPWEYQRARATQAVQAMRQAVYTAVEEQTQVAVPQPPPTPPSAPAQPIRTSGEGATVPMRAAATATRPDWLSRAPTDRGFPSFPTTIAPESSPRPLAAVAEPAPDAMLGGLRRLEQSWGPQYAGAVQAWVQGQTVVLRGTAPSVHDGRLAEDVMRLEPGVWDVRNEMAVTTGMQFLPQR